MKISPDVRAHVGRAMTLATPLAILPPAIMPVAASVFLGDVLPFLCDMATFIKGLR